MFLLKGHEDLHQDERVMQLFILVNTILENNPSIKKEPSCVAIHHKMVLLSVP